MKIIDTPIKDLYIIELEKREDDRGFFARAFCVNELKAAGLNKNIVQINNSFTKKKHTLRGMHYQLSPKAETRIVRCLKGKMWDVSLDLRPDSPTFGQSFGMELSCDNRKAMYIPEGFAHGFITLDDDTEVMYLVTEFYSPEYERVIRWDDPRFSISWPFDPVYMSDKDKNQPDFIPEFHLPGGFL